MTFRSFAAAAALTALVTVPAVAQTPNTTAPAPVSPMGTPTVGGVVPTTDVFFRDAMLPTHWRASEAVGMAVFNRAGERIGEIDELLLDASGRVLAAVVGVGGFLGIGERKVAITFRSFEMTRESDGKARLLIDMPRQALQNAPEYKPAEPRRS